MTPQQLRSEIDIDPEGLGYAAPYAALNDVAVAALLNASVRPQSGAYRSLTRADMLRIVTGLGAGPALDAAKATNPAAWALMIMLVNPESTVDMGEEGNRQLVPALNAVTEGLGDAMLSAAEMGPRSRAEELGWPTVSADDVCRTRDLT